MTEHEDLNSIARISRLATETVRSYIKVQDSVFKFSIMKALGFKETDTASAAILASQLKDNISGLLESVRAMKLEKSDPIGDYCITLRVYLRTVEEAIDGFIGLCNRMTEAKADKRSRYWRDNYKKDLKAYQLKEADYMKIGIELNEKWARVKKMQAAAQTAE